MKYTYKDIIRVIKLMVFIVVMMVILSGCQDQKNEITIYFESNGGPQISEITYDLSDATLELPQPTKEGYDFIGWYMEQTLENEVTYQDLLNRDVLTLYAKWAPDDRTYRVTYQTDDPDTTKTVDVKAYEKPEIYAPKKDGYVFSGWYLDEDYENIYDYQQGITNYTVLYAKWEEESDRVLTVVFSDDYTYQFNLENETMPDMREIIPNELRLNVRRYFYDPFFRIDFDDDQATYDHSFTIYAELFNKHYVRYDQMNIDFPEQKLTDELMYKNGQIYYYGQKDAYAQDGSHHAKIYEPYRFVDTVLEDQYITDAFAISDRYLIITLENHEQYLVNMLISSNYDVFTNVQGLTFLNEDEYVVGGQVMYNTFLLQTNQDRFIYFGSIYAHINFDNVEVTNAFDLEEGEKLIFDYDQTDNYSIKTTLGNIYALSLALENFPEVIDRDEDQMFTKANDQFIDDISLFKMYLTMDHIVYFTTDGHVYVKSINLIEFHIDPTGLFEPGEEVIDFYGTIMITNHNRFFEHNQNLELVNLSETVFKDLEIEHYAFGYYNGQLLIKTTSDEVFLYRNELINITDHLDAYDLDASNITSGPRFEIKDGLYTYVISQDGTVDYYTHGYINTHIFVALKDNELLSVERYIDDQYQVRGYLSNGKVLPEDEIIVNQDMHLKLIYQEVVLETVNLIIMGKQYKIEALQGSVIEEADILELLPEAFEIDYLSDNRNQSTIAFPFVVTKDLSINVHTKPKVEALALDIKFVTEHQVLDYGMDYALEGDQIMDAIDLHVPVGFDIDFISYDLEGNNIISDQDLMTEDEVIYVHLKAYTYPSLTIHLTDDVTIVTDYNISIYPYGISSFIANYYHIDFDSINIIGIYKDEAMTMPWTHDDQMDEDVEIWVDLLDLEFLYMYQVLDGEIVDRYELIIFDGLPIDLTYLNEVYDIKYLEINEIYYDQGLTQPVLNDDVIDHQTHQLFYTTQVKDSFSIKVHIYDDLKDLYIESIDINYKEDNIYDILATYGYTVLGVFNSDDFSQPYVGSYEAGTEVYVKVLTEYVTLDIHNLDLDETYLMKYPKNIRLSEEILDIYLSEIDPLYHLYSYYKDEALTIDAIDTYMTSDLTIYIKKDVTMYHHVVFEFVDEGSSYEIYLEDQMIIDALYVYNDILKFTNPLAQRFDVILYNDVLLTEEIEQLTIDQDQTIYVSFVNPTTYEITYKNIETDEVIFVKAYPVMNVSVYSELYEYYQIPYTYRNQWIIYAYLDVDQTIPVSLFEVTEDQVIYVKAYKPRMYEVTYHFMNTELDPITLALKENQSVNQIAILEALYDYYGDEVQVNFSLFNLDNYQPIFDYGVKSDMNIGVSVDTKDVYLLTFIYLDPYGFEHHFYMRFVEGEKIDKGIFYGTIINNPNEVDIKFHYTSELINGTSKITVNESRIYYVELIEIVKP